MKSVAFGRWQPSRSVPVDNDLQPEDHHQTKFDSTRKLMPERDRLARMLFEEVDLRSNLGCQVMADLVALSIGAAQRPRQITSGLLDGSYPVPAYLSWDHE